MHSQEPLAIRRLWGLAEAPSRGPRARTDLHAIAEAGVEIADIDGLEGVTLAAVANRLGLTTTALYRHVDSKETLLELMADEAIGSPVVVRRRPPRARINEIVRALWDRYHLHPWLSTYPIMRPPRCPYALAWMDLLITELAELEVDDPLSHAMALDVLVRGYSALDLVAAMAEAPSVELASEIGRRHPLLVEGTSRPGALFDDLIAAIQRQLA